MIQFEDLDLITVIKGKHYKIVFDDPFSFIYNCSKCAFIGLSICREYACSSGQHQLQYHYEEIPKKTNPANRRLCDER